MSTKPRWDGGRVKGMQEVLELRRQSLVRLYYSLGFTLIPLYHTTGTPLIPWKEFEDPRSRSSLQRTESWFAPDNENGIAVLCGAASDHIYCIDDDEGILQEALHGNLNALHTLLQASPHGYHLFLRDRKCEIGKLDFRLAAPGSRAIRAEIKGNGQLVTLEPSLHRESHTPYRTISPDYTVRDIDGIICLFIERMKELGWKALLEYRGNGRPLTVSGLVLTEEESSKLRVALGAVVQRRAPYVDSWYCGLAFASRNSARCYSGFHRRACKRARMP